MKPRFRTAAELLATARRDLVRLSPHEASQQYDLVFVDTRDSGDRRREGIIADSVWIPRSVLLWRVDPMSDAFDARVADRSLRLIIVCNDGFSSSLDAAALQEMGFCKATDLEGGYRAWRAAGLPISDVSWDRPRTASGIL